METNNISMRVYFVKNKFISMALNADETYFENIPKKNYFPKSIVSSQISKYSYEFCKV